MTKLRVTLVTQWYPPEPAQQPEWIADALAADHCDVNVLTGVPNYPNGVVAPGYRAWQRSREVLNGRVVTRTPLYPSHDSSSLRRILNYASWALTAALWGGRAFASSEVSLVYSSPATAALPAMWQRRRRGVPYVMIVQDLWPDSIFSSGFLRRPSVRRVVEPIVNAFVNRTYRNASGVVVISPGMADFFSNGACRKTRSASSTTGSTSSCSTHVSDPASSARSWDCPTTMSWCSMPATTGRRRRSDR